MEWESGVCQTTSGLTVYADTGNTAVTQEQCSGYALISGSDKSVIMTNVGSGEMKNQILDATDDSYRFSGGDYQIAEAYLGTYSQIYDEMILLTCNGEQQLIGDDYCYSDNFYYTLAYDTNNVQYTTMKSALDQAVSDGYLTDDNIKNYVCFGSNGTPCPEENLYRIIGVFNGQVKLIKADYATSEELGINGGYHIGINKYSMNYYIGSLDKLLISNYEWNTDDNGYYNVWSKSSLNTVNLNINYLNNLGSTWSNLIATYSWKVGGMPYSNGRSTPKTAYNYEIGSNSSNTTYSAKIGLMYVSDYGFAASPSYWTTNMNSYSSANNNNWMYMGLFEWTISRRTDSSQTVKSAFNLDYYGNIEDYGTGGTIFARPVFYLNSDVQYISGTGTQSDPFRIA